MNTIAPIYRDESNEKNTSPYTDTPRPTSAIIKQRGCCNRTGRIFYLIQRLFYISFWFYWGPFLELYLAFIVPFSFGAYDDRKEPEYYGLKRDDDLGVIYIEEGFGFK